MRATVFMHLIPVLAAGAAVRLASPFTDNMVLQRNTEAAIWGRAEPGETVTVKPSWRDAEVFRADADGVWRGVIKTAGEGQAHTLVVSGSSTVTVRNILMGEVWLCSGQSNMEWAMGRQKVKDMAAEIPAAQHPLIRLFKVPKRPLDQPGDAVDATWVECTPATITNFSAVGYFFGRELRGLLGAEIPVGLIDASWGGTEIEKWISRKALEGDADFRDHLDPVKAKAYDDARVAVHKELGLPPPFLVKRQASALFNGMIAPLIPFSIRGAIWYQGESNIYRAEQYRRAFPLMIGDWRDTWHSAPGASGMPEKDFPFYFVQIAPFSGYTNWVMPRSSAELREAQAMTARSVTNVGMVVSTDLVNDLANIHPEDKQTVGYRLAHLAAARTYGLAEQVVEGPSFEALAVSNDTAVVIFANTAGGLGVRDAPLRGFELAGTDFLFRAASAVTVAVDRVVLRAEGVPAPVAVRFAWDEAPQPNLFNGAGLPAVPFRTDTQPCITADVKW